MATINQEQRDFVNKILYDLHDISRGDPAKCRTHFLDEPGGNGQTTVYNSLRAVVEMVLKLQQVPERAEQPHYFLAEEPFTIFLSFKFPLSIQTYAMSLQIRNLQIISGQ